MSIVALRRKRIEPVSIAPLKPPTKKLVVFFKSTRDKWKAKYFAKRDEAKLLANQVRAVEKSRKRWRTVAEQAKRETQELKAFFKK